MGVAWRRRKEQGEMLREKHTTYKLIGKMLFVCERDVFFQSTLGVTSVVY